MTAPVLIVDDNAEMLRVVERVLGYYDYAGVSVASGEDAVAYLDANVDRYLCMVDVTLPGITGYDVLDHVVARQHPAQIVLMSGAGAVGALDAPNLLGFLQKPFGFEDLKALLDVFEAE